MSGIVAGCLDKPGGGNGDSNGGGTGTGTKTESGMNLAIISGPGGFGDKAYNDKALEGLNKAVDEFGGSINKVQGEGGQYGSLQSQLAESGTEYDLIVCVGFYQAEALKQSAKKYSDQNWMIINQGLFKKNGKHFENVAGYVWANHQMSFLAGVTAGTATTRDLSNADNSNEQDGTTVGFVGGVDSALIRAFEKAYVKGVHWANKDIDVKVGYAGSFQDPGAGKEVALSQYDNGADIIYHAAAGTGPGIFEAAKDRNRFAIGVDADQSKTLPKYSDVIVGSAVKYINVGTYEVAKGIRNGKWSQVSGKHTVGLAQDGVAFVKGKAVGSKLPDAVDNNLSDAKSGIVNGDIEVPCSATGCK